MKNIILIGLVLAVVEIAIWIGVAQLISGWWIFLATVLALVIGMNIIRSSLAGVMPQMQNMQQMQAVDASPQMTTAFAKAFAGFLFLLPGFLTDVLALLLFIPSVQTKVQTALMGVMAKRQQGMMQEMMKNMGGMNGMGGGAMTPEMMEQLMRSMGGDMGGNPSAGPASGMRRPTVIDGEARHVSPEVKKIQSANDD
jgi:UPF0716 protein FxsA